MGRRGKGGMDRVRDRGKRKGRKRWRGNDRER